ncbi:MAG: sigma-70 family RNA polymerase sigma factor [Planctomycetota bacterium]
MTETKVTAELIEQARNGDQSALNQLLRACEPRLLRTVDLYMDTRLQRVVSVEQIVQDTFGDAAHLIREIETTDGGSFYVWLRGLAATRLSQLHQEHVGSSETDGMDVTLHRGRMPQTTSFALASKLIGNITELENESIRAERKIKLQSILNTMAPEDREVLAMRHFEQLSFKETAIVMGLSEAEVGMKFLKALRRLKQFMEQMPGLTKDAK